MHQVRVRATSDGGTVTAFIEEALRAALAHLERPRTSEPHRVPPSSGGGLRPGVDLDDQALPDLVDGAARP